MYNNWVAVLFSCNKLIPVVWDIFDSEEDLDQFVLGSDIIEIHNSKSESENDKCYYNCGLNIHTDYRVFKINEKSYNYFTSKQNYFWYNQHFDMKNHMSCKPFIIAIEKNHYKICDIMGNLEIY